MKTLVSLIPRMLPIHFMCACVRVWKVLRALGVFGAIRGNAAGSLLKHTVRAVRKGSVLGRHSPSVHRVLRGQARQSGSKRARKAQRELVSNCVYELGACLLPRLSMTAQKDPATVGGHGLRVLNERTFSIDHRKRGPLHG